MSIKVPPGAQRPETPHPGTITFKYLWNKTTTIEDASKFSESSIFYCCDMNGRPAPRAAAAWCIPVVEVHRVSVDKEMKPVAPQDANVDCISDSIFGPERRHIKHTVWRRA